VRLLAIAQTSGLELSRNIQPLVWRGVGPARDPASGARGPVEAP